MDAVQVNCSKITRRGFLGICAAGCGAALGLAGCQSERLCRCKRKRYKVVEGWAKVPAGFEFDKVTGIAVDKRGRVYATGGKGDPVLMFSSEGEYIGAWGGDVIGLKHGLRIHNESVWVTDVENHQVYEFTMEGELLRSFGTRGQAGEGRRQFNRPADVAFGANGDIYIADGYVNSRVVCYGADGRVKKMWGRKGSGQGEFDLVHGIAIDKKGRVYVADRNNRRVQIFDGEGKFLKQWRHVGKPFSFYIAGDVIFITDGKEEGPEQVLIVDLEGRVLGKIGETGEGPGQFRMPHSVHVTEKGEVYIAEAINNRIQKFVPIK